MIGVARRRGGVRGCRPTRRPSSKQLEDDTISWKTRIEHITQPPLLRMAKAETRRQEAPRDLELRHVHTVRRSQPDLANRLDLVLSVPGIGLRTALAIVAHARTGQARSQRGRRAGRSCPVR